ncbi:MAG: IclR family transcriptional regulator [Nocardiopsaceae bacterium]|nr:IclR family transcriptional regulator [Nocardiopsaceae bacterium]
MSNSNGTQAIDRAAGLLAEVVHSAGPVTFTELTAACGLAKSTTSRLLLALERNGLVRRDEAGRFLPGDMFVSFAWRGGEASLVTVAQPFLDRLGRATGETVNLGVVTGGEAEVIAQVESTYLIGGTNWVGLPVPLHCSAIGKVLLAYGAPGAVTGDRLERRTGKTITTAAALAADLARVRTRGYAVTDGELEPGLVSLAAPVFRHDGMAVAGLSVSAPAARMTGDRPATAARACVAEASALSAALGHRPKTGTRESPKTRKAGAA